MKDEVLTLEELCDLLKLSRSTIDRLRKQGMPYIKIGNALRFEKEKVFEWLRGNKQ